MENIGLLLALIDFYWAFDCLTTSAEVQDAADGGQDTKGGAPLTFGHEITDHRLTDGHHDLSPLDEIMHENAMKLDDTPCFFFVIFLLNTKYI